MHFMSLKLAMVAAAGAVLFVAELSPVEPALGGQVCAPGTGLSCGGGGGGGVRYSRGGGGGSYDIGGAVNMAIWAAQTAAPLVNNLANSAPTFNAPNLNLGTLPVPKLGMPDVNTPPTDAERAADCRGMRKRLQPHARDEEWIADQMARSGCRPNGTRMSLRDRLKRDMASPAPSVPDPLQVLNGMFQPSAPPPNKRGQNSDSTITGLSH